MKKINFFLVVAIVLVLSMFVNCQRKKDTNDSKKSRKQDKSELIKTKEIKTLNDYLLLDDDIDVNLIKKQMNGFTSSLSSKGSKFLNESELTDKDFIGLYYLIINSNQKIADVICGKMIVYNSINPWIYENKTDKFLEINLWKKGISLFNNSIEIGSHKSDLIKTFGNKYKIINDVLIFEGKKLTGLFKIKNDTVDYIKIGKYKQNFDYQLTIDKMTEF